MTIPLEFTSEYVTTHSEEQLQHHRAFLRSGEPFRSMLKANPWLRPLKPGEELFFDGTRYWDTTTADQHPYWREHVLPVPNKDIRQLRQDLHEWGYCLIEDGLSAAQCEQFVHRLRNQAEGERAAGVDQYTPSGQQINTLVNKGRCFAGCIEQHPDHVQAGPVIEQLMNETLGDGWICHSFLAICADPGGHPQGLHIDQGPLLPWMTEQAPALMNTMYIPQDVDEVNGGTLMIPGSHKIMIDAGSGGQIGQLPPAINLKAKAGTVMLFDGRVLHGTGANRSDDQRLVAVMSNVKNWMRTQENWVVSVAPEVLAQASPKLRHRMGLQALTWGATVEGFGMGAPGRIDDVWGDIAPFREAQERGEYHRVRELSAASPTTELEKAYTIRHVQHALREDRKLRKAQKADTKA